MEDYERISDSERVSIAENFIRDAPPGEFNEVFNDVRVLLDADNLLKTEANKAFAAYDTDQFTPCKVNNAEHSVLITKHGRLDGSRFYDPSSKQQFHYDHLRKEASDVEPWHGHDSTESWRLSVEQVMREYIAAHYPDGNLTVYSQLSTSDEPTKVVICIEDHQFQPHNFWNGRWRSEWTVLFNPSNADEPAVLSGALKLQVHYYEDGNVQLVSNKDIEAIEVNANDPESLAKGVQKSVKAAETKYQTAINENYEKMSTTAFKSLRRQLPITRTKIDWNKIVSYKVGKDLKS